jgi:type I restriction enzyme S subunit
MTRRYPAYKDSGVEWLGPVPEGWAVGKFRHQFRESPEKIESEVVGPMLSVSGYRGIEIKDYDDENRRRLDEDLVGYRIVRPGQLVVNTMWLNYAGLGVSEFEGHVSPAYRSYEFRQSVDRRYFHHLLRSSIYVQGYTQLLTGVRPNSLQMSREDLMDFPVVQPPLLEQTAIAAFLDRETAKIDALVAEQRRLIDLLREKRQAVISHAVTKGLNPNARMKPSGIDWLGEVPGEWSVRKLGDLTFRIGDGLHGTPIYDDSADCFFINGNNLSNGFVQITETTRSVSQDTADMHRVDLGDNTLLMSINGTIGNLALYRGEDVILGKSAAYINCSSELSRHFLFFVLQAGTTKEFFASTISNTTISNLSLAAIRGLRFGLPPINEQAKIADILYREMASFDRLIDTADRAAVLLQERRAALISAAVTGKIDLRHVAPQAAEAS